MSDVAGKRVLVTGGSSGIGLLVAKRLAARGARVALWDLDEGRLREAARSIGGDVEVAVVDVSRRSEVERAASELGPVDVLVNNAGIVRGKPLLELAPEDVEATFGTNVLAHFWTLRAFLPAMIARDAGHVVTIASASAICAVPKLAAYSASKAAAFALDESLRLELERGGSHVQTTIVCPFYVDTGMFRGVKTRFAFLLPILKPDVVADRIVGAILRGRRRLILPRIVAITWLLRLLPVRWFDALAAFLGVTTSMDEFVGRPAEARPRPPVHEARLPQTGDA